MKNMKKLVGLLLALVMTFAMTMTAFADEPAPTGSITINKSENVSVVGKTFNAYKILDLEMIGTGEEAGYVYTVPEVLKGFYATKFTLDQTATDFDHQVYEKIKAMSNNSTELFAFAKVALAAAKAANIEAKTVEGKTGAESVTISNLPLGYYVIEDTAATTPVSALMLDTTNPNVNINIKADKPSIEKKIDGDKDTDDNTAGKVDFNNAAIGDNVPYVLTSKVPDMTGYTKYFYVVTDTLSSGLTFNNDVAITVGSKTLVKDTDYTVTSTTKEDGSTFVEIVFKSFIQYNKEEYIGKEITIKYSAKVDTDAVIGTAGNPNEVVLEYSNNPNVEAKPDLENNDKPTNESPTGKTPEDITYTYVTDLIIDKVNDKSNKLANAEFTLTGEKLNIVVVEHQGFVEATDGEYWKLTDETYTTIAPTEGGDNSAYVDVNKKYKLGTVEEIIKTKENVTCKAVTDSNGKITFTGLSAGTYTITEIKAPAGYNLLENPITIKIEWKAPAENSTTHECTWTYSSPAVENVVTVLNQTGAELPSTGGIGTTLFYVAGTIMMFGAAVMMVSRKRQEI